MDQVTVWKQSRGRIGAIRLKGEVTGQTSTVDRPEYWLTNALSGGPVASGVAVNDNTALTCSTILAIVTVLSQDLAKLPLKVWRLLSNGDRQPLPRHPVARLLRRPNRWQTAFEFISFLVLWIVLRGNAYAWKRREGNRVVELVPIRADRVTINVDPESAEIFYAVARGDEWEMAALRGAPQMISAEDMLHVKGESRNAYQGMSLVGLLREGVGLSLAMERHGSTMFGRGTVLSGFLKTEEELGEPAIKRLSTQWQQLFGGGGNSWKTPVLEKGMTYEKLGMSSEDSQFLESRQFQVVDIARPYRIPLHKLQDLTRSTFNNIEHQSLEYYTDALMPQAERFEGAFENSLFTETEQDELEIEFEFDRILRGDFKTRMEGLQIQADTGAIDLNEFRREIGRNAVDSCAVFRRALNTAYVDANGDPVSVTPAGGDDPVGE